jgi:hypothetical protein
MESGLEAARWLSGAGGGGASSVTARCGTGSFGNAAGGFARFARVAGDFVVSALAGLEARVFGAFLAAGAGTLPCGTDAPASTVGVKGCAAGLGATVLRRDGIERAVSDCAVL